MMAMSRHRIGSYALAGIGGLAALAVIYLAGNPDAREAATRIFSGSNKPAVVREYKPAQAANLRPISYREITPEEAIEQYGISRFLPEGSRISKAIVDKGGNLFASYSISEKD